MSDELLKRIKQLNEITRDYHGIKMLPYDGGRHNFQGQEVNIIWLDEDAPDIISQEEVDEIFDKVLFTKELEEELKKSNTKEKRKLKI